MANGKNSIIVYRDWKKIFDELTDEEAGKLIKHFFSYVNDEEPELDDKYLKMAFLPIKGALQRDLKHWESVKKSRSEAGRIGGLRSGESRNKINQNESNEANASKMKQNEANEAVSVIVNDNVNDSVIVNDNVNINTKTWRNDFDVYKDELRVEYNKLISDKDFITQQEKYYPGIDIKLSLEKACVNYWATEAGWKKKKSKREGSAIDWKATLTNAISLNKVYK